MGWVASPFSGSSEVEMFEWRTSAWGERIGPLVKLAGRNWPQVLYVTICPQDKLCFNNETSRERR